MTKTLPTIVALLKIDSLYAILYKNSVYASQWLRDYMVFKF